MEERRTARRCSTLAALLGVLCALALASAPAGAIQTVEYRAGITQGPAGGLAAIAAGPDGNLWFTERSGRIGRITPDGVATEFDGFPPTLGIAAGSDGAIWFTEDSGQLGRITVDGATRTSFPLGAAPSGQPFWLVGGPDGALWFTLLGGGAAVGRMTTAGAVSLFTPSYTPPSQPAQIAAGPDGALWYTEEGTAIEPEHPSAGTTFRGLARLTTAGAITPFPLRARGISPLAIAAGPDGAVWFTASPKIGRLTSAGRYELFDARLPRYRHAGSIVTGPDGNLWYGIGGGYVGRMTRKGFATIFPTPSRDFAPGELAVGTDRNIWMTDETGGVVKIVAPQGRCVVPQLVGLRYTRATRRLHRAGCAVGRVSAPKGSHHRRLSVQHQFPRDGTRLPAESVVDLTLRR